MKYVIAGNYRQYQNWLKETKTPPQDAVYIADNRHLMGLVIKPEDIVFTGESWRSPVDLDLLITRCIVK